MTHVDHVNLITQGISQQGGIWADFGSGTGAFTLALRDIAGPEVTIYSIDIDKQHLEVQQEAFDAHFSDTHITYINTDFTHPLDLPPLDGIIMANSLHYSKNKVPFLKQLKQYLKKTGRIIVVEYNVDKGNRWVPYPVSFHSFRKIAEEAGFEKPELLSSIPSHFLNEMYSASTA